MLEKTATVKSQKRTCPHHGGMDRGEGSDDMLLSVASDRRQIWEKPQLPGRS